MGITSVVADGQEVQIAVNEDEEEVRYTSLQVPRLRDSGEFPKELLQQGMMKELQAMKDFKVFKEVQRSSLTPDQQRSILTSRWVHRWKGDEVRSRLVARGYDQHIKDLDDVYASTPILVSLRLLLAVSLSCDWSIVSADVSTAFLHAELRSDVPIFMMPPSEFYPDAGKNVLWQLQRAMYGLRSAPRDWQDHFASTLRNLKYHRLQSDPNVYVHYEQRIILLVYVDDLLFFGDARAASSSVSEASDSFSS